MVTHVIIVLSLILIPFGFRNPKICQGWPSGHPWWKHAEERYGGIPYARPPIGKRRFAAAELWDTPWPEGHVDVSCLESDRLPLLCKCYVFFSAVLLNKARRTGAPCINNPLGDPRSMPLDADHSPPPSEDCLHLSGPQWLRFSPSHLWLNWQATFSRGIFGHHRRRSVLRCLSWFIILEVDFAAVMLAIHILMAPWIWVGYVSRCSRQKGERFPVEVL